MIMTMQQLKLLSNGISFQLHLKASAGTSVRNMKEYSKMSSKIIIEF